MKSLRDLMDLRGRVAAITGATGHIGSAIAGALAELGASIAVLDIDADRVSHAAARLQSEYAVETLPLTLDLAHQDDLLSVPDQLLDRWNRLDILIHCAALVGTSDLKGWNSPFLEQSAQTWRLALEVNLTAPFLLTQACAPALAASGHGSVINIGSTYGVLGPDLRLYEGTSMHNPAAYAAAKGGLVQLTRWLATVLAPDVRVNAISPGGVWRNQPQSFVDRYVARTPLGRMASEQDFKGSAAYLASDLSQYVTGQNLMVDGGWSAW